MKCTNCGREILDSAKFCMNCGAQTDTAPSVGSPTPVVGPTSVMGPPPVGNPTGAVQTQPEDLLSGNPQTGANPPQAGPSRPAQFPGMKDYSGKVKNSFVFFIASAVVGVAGVMLGLFVHRWIGAGVLLAAELLALLPRSGFNQAFKKDNAELLKRDRKAFRQKAKQAEREIGKQNPVYKLLLPAGIVWLVLLIVVLCVFGADGKPQKGDAGRADVSQTYTDETSAQQKKPSSETKPAGTSAKGTDVDSFVKEMKRASPFTDLEMTTATKAENGEMKLYVNFDDPADERNYFLEIDLHNNKSIKDGIFISVNSYLPKKYDNEACILLMSAAVAAYLNIMEPDSFTQDVTGEAVAQVLSSDLKDRGGGLFTAKEYQGDTEIELTILRTSSAYGLATCRISRS